MRRLFLIPAVAAAVLLIPACGVASQAPQTDKAAETVTVQRAADDSKQPQTAATRDDSGRDDSGKDDDGIRDDDGARDDDGVRDDDGIRDDDDGNQDDDFDRDADDNLQAGRNLPDGFPVPVPDAYRVEAVGTAGHETAVILRVPSDEDAYNYYRQVLPQNGFRLGEVERERSGHFEAELDFFNDTFKGEMEFEGDTVKIEVESRR